MMWHYGDGPGLWMLLWMAAFWIGLILLIGWGIRRAGPSSESAKGAIDILQERYARGEIDTEEFQARRTHLSGV